MGNSCCFEGIYSQARDIPKFKTPFGDQRNQREALEKIPVGQMDRRKKVTAQQRPGFEDAVVRLELYFKEKNGTEQEYQGSASIAKFNNKNVYFLLTAAHNLFERGTDPALSGVKKVVCHWKGQPYACTKWSVHDDYKKMKGGFQNGTDIGVITIPDSLKRALGATPKCVVVDEPVLASAKLKHSVITVSGYPVHVCNIKGNRDQWFDKGQILEEGYFPHQGNGDEPWFVEASSPANAKVCYYGVQTTGGTSGAPLVKSSQSGQNWMVVGVHAIGTDKKNGGTTLKATAMSFLKARSTSHGVRLS